MKEDESDTIISNTAKRLVSELKESRVQTLMAFARGLRDYHTD
jgi:hypothetical protein